MFKRKILRQRSSRDEFQKNVKPIRIDFDFDLPRKISIAVRIRGKLQVVAFELRCYRVAYLPGDQDYLPFHLAIKRAFMNNHSLASKKASRRHFKACHNPTLKKPPLIHPSFSPPTV
jgi:hypothetical protein